jgi:hypothetical protein
LFEAGSTLALSASGDKPDSTVAAHLITESYLQLTVLGLGILTPARGLIEITLGDSLSFMALVGLYF